MKSRHMQLCFNRLRYVEKGEHELTVVSKWTHETAIEWVLRQNRHKAIHLHPLEYQIDVDVCE